MADVFRKFTATAAALGVRAVRVVGNDAPRVVSEQLARSKIVSFHPADPMNPASGIARAGAGLEGDVVLLTGGNIWIEDALNGLVEEHRAHPCKFTICDFHAGFSPIVTSAAALAEIPAAVRGIDKHLRGLVDAPGGGVRQIRRDIPNRNTYARPDQPEGWQCLAWLSRTTEDRAAWSLPHEFREGQVCTRENYRRSFRSMETFQTLEGARVLEVGCSPINTAGPRILLEEFGVRTYTGVNLDKIVFDWKHPSAAFHVGDAAEAPFAPESFDLAFSISVWEHVQNPRRLFNKVSEWLVPHGGHYGKFPLWSSEHGYHLPPAGFAGGRLPPFCHLTMTPHEVREHMRRVGVEPSLADHSIRRIFEDPYINRVRGAEFIDIIKGSGLEIVFLDGRNAGRLQHAAIRAAAQLDGEYTAEELSVKGLEFFLRKSAYRLLDIANKRG